MRVAIYARYSSDNQRDASIEDQLRLCRELATSKGWQIVKEFSDAAQSGATLHRSGVQRLLQFAEQRQCDVVLAESMSRFSRGQRDIAEVHERLKFVDVTIFTLSEGEVSEMHIGLKGTMNALYLKDLSEQTWRGQRGNIEAGKVAGGLCYGYAPVVGALGERAIVPREAAIVRRVFQDYMGGLSPKAIAKKLNSDGIAPPRGLAWHPSAINGNVARGTGLLNNELYVGRLVWNRLEYRKDRNTGKRVSRVNPASTWIVKDVPELRIIDDATWQAVKGRQQRLREIVNNTGFMRAKRPAFLFTGMTKCARCGCGYCMFNRTRLACTGARDKGICDNRQTIKREEVEARVLEALQNSLWREEAFSAFTKRLTLRLNQQRIEARAGAAAAEQELVTVNRRIGHLTRLFSDGMDSPSLRAELQTLEQQRASIAARAKPVSRTILHPNMGDAYRRVVMNLRGALEQPEAKAKAIDALRRHVSAIRLTPTETGTMLIEWKVNPGSLLSSVGISAASSDGCGGLIPPELADWMAA